MKQKRRWILTMLVALFIMPSFVFADSCNHYWGDALFVYVPPQGCFDGSGYRLCEYCFERKDETIPATEGCVYKLNWKSCTDGETYVCIYCRGVKIVNDTPTEHNWEEEWSVDEEGSCLTKRKLVRSCLNCYELEEKTIPAPGHTWGEWEVYNYAKVGSNGTMAKFCEGEYYCEEWQTKVIYAPEKVKLSKTIYTYDGKAKKPTVKVYDSENKVIDSSNYTVAYAKGRTNVGEYKVTIQFKSDGKYSGKMTATFKITPKATSVKKLTTAKKAFTVKLNKVSNQATGYEIMYATNSKFTKGKKTVKVTSYKTTSKKIASLKSKTKYYVKVRTYKTVHGKKYYSDWSKYKTVTTK